MALTISLNAKAITVANLNRTQLITGAATQQNYLRTGYNIVDTCLRSVTFSRDDKNVSTLILRGNELGLSRSIAPLKNLTLLEKLQTINISNNGLSQVQVSNIVNQLYQSALINSLRAVNYNIGGNNAIPDVKALIQLDELQNNYGFIDDGVFRLTTDQSILAGINMSITGTAGKSITIDYGDGNVYTHIFTGGADVLPVYNYLSTGIYTIRITGDLSYVTEYAQGGGEGITDVNILPLLNLQLLELPSQLLTYVDLSSNDALKTVNFNNNEITNTDDIICKINSNNLNGGIVNLSFGTNAALTATGLACKSDLVSRGYTVLNN